MEWLGFLSFFIILCYSSYPGKVKKLESQMKKVRKKETEENKMSKIISELVGKKCIITTTDALQFIGDTKVKCNVLDVDDEWIKISYTEKKGNTKIRIMRIDSIDGVEVEEE